MTFNWQTFLVRHRIVFDTDRGGRNAILQCPFCGAADSKKHDLSISLKGRGWKCWRNRAHRGRSNARLIAALIRCSFAEAQALAGEEVPPPLVANSSLLAELTKLVGAPAPYRPAAALQLPGRLLSPGGMGRPFWDYMLRRGYSAEQVQWLTRNYALRYVLAGPFRWRIVIPIVDERGRVLSWTARAVVASEPIRYKTLAADLCTAPPGHSLLGLDVLWRAPAPRVLVVTEGPFDAFRISAIGAAAGIYGTCLFGLNPSSQQAELLFQLRQRFPTMRLLLDRDAALRTLAVLQSFATLPITSVPLPVGYKDPGAMTGAAAEEFVATLL